MQNKIEISGCIKNRGEGNILSNHMGPSFDNLSPLLRQVHNGSQYIEGTVKIERGNMLASIICSIFRFPKSSKACTLKVKCHHTSNSILWVRNFNGHIMKSSFSSNGIHMIETLGPLDLAFSPNEKNGSLTYNFVSTKLFGITTPKIFSPIIYALEYEENNEYKFRVSVKMHMIGLILSYGGTMRLMEVNND